MVFLKKIKKLAKSPLMLGVFLFIAAAISAVTVFAQTPNTILDGELPVGTIIGWGWMGTGIQDPNISQGGGGWIKFNCAPTDCTRTSNWGMNINLDPTSPDYGNVTGEAWSSNYGWLTTNPAVTEKCWVNNPGVTFDGPAKVINLTSTNLDKKPMVGWMAFPNGDDVSTDGYDGCVAMTGVEHAVLLDIQTGVLSGWAWGSDVVGWVSFSNPECPFCDTTVVLDGFSDIVFTADNTTVATGMGTVLRWAPINSPASYIKKCSQYSNTRNYQHWSDLNLTSLNVGEISLVAGNIPGSHPVNGINQTVTYSLRCERSNNQFTDTKYVTVNVSDTVLGCTDRRADNFNPGANRNDGSCIYGPVVPGCMNPLATNYNPLANVEDGSCVIPPPVVGCMDPTASNYNPEATLPGPCDSTPPPPPRTTLTLDIETAFFNDGEIPYNAININWRTNNESRIEDGTCRGTFEAALAVRNLNGWTGARVDPLGLTGGTPQIPSLNMTPFITSSGLDTNTANNEPLKFTITCNLTTGSTISATDTIFLRHPVVPVEPDPELILQITNPDQSGGLGYEELPPAGGIITLDWSASTNTDNIIWDSCQGVSAQNPGSSSYPNPNPNWAATTARPYNQGLGDMQVSMTHPNNLPTRYTLTCRTIDNVQVLSNPVNVCIEGTECPFAPPGSTIPGYVEF